MSLPAAEQRALRAMERLLEASEPRMTAMFAMFTRLARAEMPVSAERLARRQLVRSWPDTIYVLIPVLATMALIATLVVGLATSGTPACRTAALSSPRSSVISCAGRELRPSGHLAAR